MQNVITQFNIGSKMKTPKFYKGSLHFPYIPKTLFGVFILLLIINVWKKVTKSF